MGKYSLLESVIVFGVFFAHVVDHVNRCFNAWLRESKSQGRLHAFFVLAQTRKIRRPRRILSSLVDKLILETPNFVLKVLHNRSVLFLRPSNFINYVL
jgi:hypothetical protein